MKAHDGPKRRSIAAVKRLALALDALDAAAERRREADRSEEGLASQLHALGVDRTKLAAALDGETARSRRLEDTNREIAQRLDAAIATIQSVLDEQRVNSMARSTPPSPAANSASPARTGRRSIFNCSPRISTSASTNCAEVRRDRRHPADGDGGADGRRRIGGSDAQDRARLEEESTALQDARVVAADRAKAASDAVVNAFNSAAERIEGITRKLNQSRRQRRRDRVGRFTSLLSDGGAGPPISTTFAVAGLWGASGDKFPGALRS